jgi:hypothetical protein
LREKERGKSLRKGESGFLMSDELFDLIKILPRMDNDTSSEDCRKDSIGFR